MKLRLYHHHDGARIAYREAGTGPGLVMLHSAGLSHREWEPLVEHLSHRFRLVLPDLPGHGDSEDRPRHPYTPDWLAEVIAGFCLETVGPRPLAAGHSLGAELLLRAVVSGRMTPARLVLMPNPLHGQPPRSLTLTTWRVAARAGALPGVDRAISHLAPRVIRPQLGPRLSVRGEPAAADLLRHAFADVPGNSNRARAWAKLARAWPPTAQRQLLDCYQRLDMPVLLLWADSDRLHPLPPAEEALARLPRGQLRVLAGTGFLIAYDDPVGVARELSAFCGARE
jgi:pimeloyl-ACP methyl ester carboxylesterase